MKSYKVWIEIEEFDDETEKHTDDPEPVSVARFADRANAELFTKQLEYLGRASAPGYEGESTI